MNIEIVSAICFTTIIVSIIVGITVWNLADRACTHRQRLAEIEANRPYEKIEEDSDDE